MCRRSVGRENFAFNVVKVFLLYSLIDCAVCELMDGSYCEYMCRGPGVAFKLLVQFIGNFSGSFGMVE